MKPLRGAEFETLQELHDAVEAEAKRRLEKIFVEPITDEWRDEALGEWARVGELDGAYRELLNRTKRTASATVDLRHAHHIRDTAFEQHLGSDLSADTEQPPAVMRFLQALENDDLNGPTAKLKGVPFTVRVGLEGVHEVGDVIERDAVAPVKSLAQWVVYQFGTLIGLELDPAGRADEADTPWRGGGMFRAGVKALEVTDDDGSPIVARAHPRAATVDELAAILLFLRPEEVTLERLMGHNEAPDDSDVAVGSTAGSAARNRRTDTEPMSDEGVVAVLAGVKINDIFSRESRRLQKQRARDFKTSAQATAFEKKAEAEKSIAPRAHLPLSNPEKFRIGSDGTLDCSNLPEEVRYSAKIRR